MQISSATQACPHTFFGHLFYNIRCPNQPLAPGYPRCIYSLNRQWTCMERMVILSVIPFVRKIL